MSESFVVSTGGSVTGGGLPSITLNSTPKIVTSVLFPGSHLVSYYANNKNYPYAAAAFVVMVLVIVAYMSIGYGIFWKMSQSFQGIGAAGTRTIKRSDAYEFMGNKPQSGDKHDTFLNTMGSGPVFNDVPNYVLRKENRMQSALHAYAKLRKSSEGTNRPLPSWNSYWADWQKSQNYDYSGRSMYDIEGGNVQAGDNVKGTDAFTPEQLRRDIY